MKVLMLVFGPNPATGTGDEFVKYEKADHAEKVDRFLFWKDFQGEELILAAPRNYCLDHKELRYRGAIIVGVPKDLKPDGAGGMFQGRIAYWKSVLLEVVTPESLRPKIEGALCL